MMHTVKENKVSNADILSTHYSSSV